MWTLLVGKGGCCGWGRWVLWVETNGCCAWKKNWTGNAVYWTHSQCSSLHSTRHQVYLTYQLSVFDTTLVVFDTANHIYESLNRGRFRQVRGSWAPPRECGSVCPRADTPTPPPPLALPPAREDTVSYRRFSKLLTSWDPTLCRMARVTIHGVVSPENTHHRSVLR